jgi:hypothetical protein
MGMVFDVASWYRGEPPQLDDLLQLQLTQWPSNVANVIASLYMVPEAAPDTYDDDRLPGQRGEFTRENMVGEWIFLSPGAGLSHTLTLWNTPEAAANKARLLSFTRLASWNGRVALSWIQLTVVSVLWTAAEAGGGQGPQLLVDHHPFHTGHEAVHPRRVRARHDPKTGLPCMGDELVEDGYTGLRTRPGDWDPPEHRPKGRPGEREDKRWE